MTDQPTKGPDIEGSRTYYRVPCEFQVRFRKIEEEELKVFKSFSLRSSPHSVLRREVEGQLSSMEIRAESKYLLEKAFQLLLNIDQRIERLEEQLQAMGSQSKPIEDHYEWVHGDLGAGGVAFQVQNLKSHQMADTLLLDIILPSLPEQRFVAAGKVIHLDEKKNELATEFLAIHEDDREFIHRFVISRERELLRARAIERERAKDEQPPS